MSKSHQKANLGLATLVGNKERFRDLLVKSLRSGRLEQDTVLWLADFFENGGAGELKIEFKRSGPGNKRQRKRINYGALWLFRMIMEETPRKDDVFERARTELRIGKNRAQEYWNHVKADIALEAEDEFRKESYLEYKRLTLLERAEQGAPEHDVG